MTPTVLRRRCCCVVVVLLLWVNQKTVNSTSTTRFSSFVLMVYDILYLSFRFCLYMCKAMCMASKLPRPCCSRGEREAVKRTCSLGFRLHPHKPHHKLTLESSSLLLVEQEKKTNDSDEEKSSERKFYDMVFPEARKVVKSYGKQAAFASFGELAKALPDRVLLARVDDIFRAWTIAEGKLPPEKRIVFDNIPAQRTFLGYVN